MRSQENLKPVPIKESGTSMIRMESVTDNEIRFETTAPGLPHIVKMSYFPNWKVEGAKRIYLVSPSFLLVYNWSDDFCAW